MYRILAVGVVASFLLAGCGGQDNPLSATGDGPQIVAMSPVPGQSFIASDERFVVQFSQSMDAASVESNFQVTAAQKPVNGQFSWNADSTAVTFQPAGGLPSSVQVQVGFGTGMQSRVGRVLVGQDGKAVNGFTYGCYTYGPVSTFASNGQRIYYTSTSGSGLPITFSTGGNPDSSATPGPGYGFSSGLMMGGQVVAGTMGTGMMGGGMMGGGMGGGTGTGSGSYRYAGMACVSCHGPDGSGGRYLAMGAVQTPDIRYSTLTQQNPAAGVEHDHPPYTDASIAEAVQNGVDPGGTALNSFMPRWSMSQQDMADLIAFLKSF